MYGMVARKKGRFLDCGGELQALATVRFRCYLREAKGSASARSSVGLNDRMQIASLRYGMTNKGSCVKSVLWKATALS